MFVSGKIEETAEGMIGETIEGMVNKFGETIRRVTRIRIMEVTTEGTLVVMTEKIERTNKIT
jgi:hypothetical protein